MQAETAVAQEGKMCARIAQTESRARMNQQFADLLLVYVEQLAIEQGLHAAIERVIENPVEGILARRSCKLGDPAANQRFELRIWRVMHMHVFKRMIGKAHRHALRARFCLDGRAE